jgi:3',5'-cyclic AMP phosphodiesterase CpdA
VPTLLHISDLHFGPNHLADRAAALRLLVEKRRPDWVVVSGDLTRRAKAGQFREARAFIDSLSAPVLAVPGNHDVPLFRVWERALAPFWAWRRHFSPELEPTLSDDEVAIVGVNSAFNWTFTAGRISRRRRERLREQLEACDASCYRVVVIHHNLVAAEHLEHFPRPPRAAAETLRLLDESGADLVLGGHAHQSFVATASDGAAPAVLLYSGTASCSRGRGVERGQNTCHWIEIGARDTRVEFLRWEPEVAGFEAREERRYPRRRPLKRGPLKEEAEA